MSGMASGDPGSPGDPGGPPGGDPYGGTPTGGGPAPGLEYATVGVRLVAYIIDVIIVGVISGAFRGIFGLGWLAWGGFDMSGQGGPDLGGLFGWGALGLGFLAWIVVSTIVSGVYFVGLWMRNGATFGQMLLGLEVRNAADGARLTQDQAIRRWAFLTVPVLSQLPAVGFLVFIYMIYLLISTNGDPAKQGFHDKQAGTVVVRRVS